MRNYIKNKYIEFIYRKRDVRIAQGCTIDIGSHFEGHNRIGRNSFFSGSLGRCTYLGEGCHITASVGRYTCIASNVVTPRGEHPTREWVTVHPAFYSTKRQCGTTYCDEDCFDEVTKEVTIGSDVWIADSCIILGGVVIGDGAIVAAGSVVTKDVEPYAIVAGNPARLIRYRFDEETLGRIKSAKWWERTEEDLRMDVDCFKTVEFFLRDLDNSRSPEQ